MLPINSFGIHYGGVGMPSGGNNFRDLEGKKFGRLLVKSIYQRGTPEGVEWNCLCECGNPLIVTSKSLKSGNTKSCGCFRSDKRKAMNLTHGMKGTKPYMVWQGMKDRCFNTNNSHYRRYGGRGITVSNEWLDFAVFWSQMKEGYLENLSIDRINNDGNCRWATAEEQNCNTSQNRFETVDGHTDTVSRLSKRYNINTKAVRRRLILGWDIDRALKTPIKHR